VTAKTAIVILLSAVFLYQPALAVDSTPSGKEAKIATREASLRAKLAQFKNRNKAQIAERINTNLNKINQNRTSQMLRHLEKMSMILDKLEQRVNAGAAIAEARASIASASAAVQAQAQNDYTITVTSESRIRTDIQQIRLKLHEDLQAIRKQVIDAKQSVANAIREGRASGTE